MNIKIVKLFTCGRGSYQLLFVQEQFRTISNQVLMKTNSKSMHSTAHGKPILTTLFWLKNNTRIRCKIDLIQIKYSLN